MAGSSCAADKAGPINSPEWRRALWIALAVNALMFAAEMTAGIMGGSKALQADALDFLGDSANYAISLGVAGLSSEEHTSELQSLIRISYAVFCLKQKTNRTRTNQ